MLLTVDVGNSHTVSGVFSGDTLLAHWRLKSDRDRTADELAIRYQALFQMAGLQAKDISGCIISSVVPALETVWLEYAKKYYGSQSLCPPFAVSNQTRTGMTIRTEHPAEVGADRIVNAVAAWEMYKEEVIVIDFGTAITFDCVNAQQEYVGGTIHPGIGISLDALANRTAMLPRVTLENRPKHKIGRTTVEAIHSGMLYGFGGLVDRMVALLTEELAPEKKGQAMQTVATGGMAQLIKPYTTSIQTVRPLLTLDGLRLIYARHQHV